MASPPRHSPSATSPPYPQHVPLPNPKKRPSLHLAAGNPSKRRKQTAGSIHSATSSAHPLRQTSFPPEDPSNESALRSPSVESDFTGVIGQQSAVAPAKTGKKRGRKPKKRITSASVKSGGRGADGAPRATSEIHDEDEDDEDDHGADLTAPAGGLGDDTDRDAERKNLAVLIDAFNPEQADRYEAYRRVKLKKEVVRKIVNHILSQSVPPTVTLTINGYTKTFIGSIIERAREVQEQWAALGTSPVMQQTNGATSRIGVDPTDFGTVNENNRETYALQGRTGGGALDPARLVIGGGREPAEEKEEEMGSGKTRLGPLQPQHLREALRRYKRDGEGGGAGLSGTSVGLGMQGAGSARLRGKRLFK